MPTYIRRFLLNVGTLSSRSSTSGVFPEATRPGKRTSMHSPLLLIAMPDTERKTIERAYLDFVGISQDQTVVARHVLFVVNFRRQTLIQP
jgi:hypothetical protein